MGSFTTQGTTARIRKVELVREYPPIYLHTVCRYCGVKGTKTFDPVYPDCIQLQSYLCTTCNCASLYVMVTALEADKIVRDRWGFYD